MLAENGGKVFSMLAADILDTEVIHTTCEIYRSIVVSPEAWSDGALTAAMFVETLLQEFLCKNTRLW